MLLRHLAAIPYSGEDNTAGYYQSSLLPGDTGFLQHTFATNPITTTTTTTEKSLNLGAMDLLGAFGGYINPFACPLAVFETRVLGEYLSENLEGHLLNYINQLLFPLQRTIGCAVPSGT